MKSAVHPLQRFAMSAAGLVAAGAAVLSAHRLPLILNGHSMAEEVVLYPAMAKSGEKGHAGMAYGEQTTAKMQMAELERIDPNTQAWADKLERGAVLHHIFEEEGTWFLDLKKDYDDQAFLTRRFREEFDRYAAHVPPSSERRSFADEGEIYQKPLG